MRTPFLSSSSVHCWEGGGILDHDGGFHDEEDDIVMSSASGVFSIT